MFSSRSLRLLPSVRNIITSAPVGPAPVRFTSLRFTSVRFTSSINPPLPPSATLVESGRLITTTPANALRPAPTMFSLHGLRTLPFWTSPNPPPGSPPADPSKSRVAYNDKVVSSVVAHLEKNFALIKEEYMSAVMGVGNQGISDQKPLSSDYDISDSDNHASLHTGQWEWHSYVQKGGKLNAFRERCPKTARAIDAIGKDLFTDTPFSYVPTQPNP
jgi:hypothetical protein